MTQTHTKLKEEAGKAEKLKNTDMAYCVPAKDYTTLQDAAYQDFSQDGSEGKTHRIYLDSLGNPTVGVGHLIMPRKGLNNQKTIEAYRQKYVALDLLDSAGNPLSNDEKSLQFTSIIQAMKNNNFKTSGGCPNYVSSPEVGKLSESGVKQSFCHDYDYWYSKVKNKFPDLDSYPLSLQLSLTHCGFAGALPKIKNTGNFVDIANQVAKVRSGKHCAAKEQQMAQTAVRQCQYLAGTGLNPLTSTRENLMMALNISEPSFTPNYDEMFKDVPAEQKQQKIAEYKNRDNIGKGSMLRGLFCGEEPEEDLVSAMFIQALVYNIAEKLGINLNNQEQAPEHIVDESGRYQVDVGDFSNFDIQSEEFAHDLAKQLSKNIKNGYLGYCRKGEPYCAGAGTGTLNQVAKNYEVFDMGVKGTGCIAVKNQLTKLNGNNSGASANCYNSLREKIEQNPKKAQVFVLTVKSPNSTSGFHYVTVAPRLDKNGEIVRNNKGEVQYNVYSFNNNRNVPIENYSLLKRAGNVFSITDIARNKELEKNLETGNQNSGELDIALMQKQRQNDRG